MTALTFPRGTPFWERATKVESGCWEWAGSRHSFGYGWAYLRGRMALAHRVAWERANGPIPVGLQVCHRCDNPPCIRPEHLFLGTNRDNILDSVAKGRRRGLDRKPAVRLAPADRVAIVARVQAGEYTTDLAREYGISRQGLQQMLAKAGVSTAGRKPRPRQSPLLDAMVAMFLDGESVPYIAAGAGLRPGRVRNSLKQRGLNVPPLKRRHLTYPHGSKYGYLQGCRCDPCRVANTSYMRSYRARLRESGAA